MAFGVIAFITDPVSVVFGELKQTLHIFLDQELQHREYLKIDPMLQQFIKLPDITQRDPSTETGNEIAVVVEMVMPAAQEFRAAGELRQSIGRVFWKNPLQAMAGGE